MTILYLFLIMSVYISPFTINSENINAVIHLSFSHGLQYILGIFVLRSLCFMAEAMNEMPAAKVGVFYIFNRLLLFCRMDFA